MAKWFILPGMGATSSMYDLLRSEVNFEVNFIDWPEYHGETSYAEVAGRVIEEHQISYGDIVGGSSLGGMVALEVAKIIRPEAVVLLGSAVNRHEIQGILSVLSPIAVVTPVSFIQTLVGKRNNLIAQMFSESDPEFIRAMCLHLPSWLGYSGPLESIFRLHGRRDHVIPCPDAGSEVIESAGHLLAITHPKESGAFLENARLQLTNHLSGR
ncbi:alpha/beta fold hydrolase [Candidatus Hydrogenedentota bacterium]